MSFWHKLPPRTAKEYFIPKFKFIRTVFRKWTSKLPLEAQTYKSGNHTVESISPGLSIHLDSILGWLGYDDSLCDGTCSRG